MTLAPVQQHHQAASSVLGFDISARSPAAEDSVRSLPTTPMPRLSENATEMAKQTSKNLFQFASARRSLYFQEPPQDSCFRFPIVLTTEI